MELIDAIILGLVEGFSEFLPISSTGHLILVTHWLGLGATDAEKRALDAFNIMIQGGAILAVVGVFWPRVRDMILGLLGRSATGLRMVRNLVVAFLPAAVIGVLLNDWIKAQLFFTGPVAAALLVGGVVLIFLRKWQRSIFHDDNATRAGASPPPASLERSGSSRTYIDLDHLTWQRALIIGLLQCLAMWPGTSRSMMTIIGGMLVGMRPRHAAEFSFLLGLPTLGGACLYEAMQMYLLNGDGPSPLEPGAPDALRIEHVLLGSLMALIAAAVAVKWMIAYLSRHGLALFGWYRIALGTIILALLWSGWLPQRPPLEAEEEHARAAVPPPALGGDSAPSIENE